MPIKNDPSTPPSMIGKIGPYTVFVTPPSTPTPTETPVFESPKTVLAPPAPPPVQPPPQQFDKSFVASHYDGFVLGFFKNAASKVQNAHSSLDDHLARWFGLNQSKYQWALDDYYESKGLFFISPMTEKTGKFGHGSIYGELPEFDMKRKPDSLGTIVSI